MTIDRRWKYALALTLVGALLGGCSDDNTDVDLGDDDSGTSTTDLVRTQDSRSFVVDEGQLAFDALEDSDVATERWTGVLDGAGYRIEVPENWNGILVMYAHGFRGEGEVLTVDSPPIRQYLVDNGYAWAASSYSANYYDVRAGLEDTNALALALTDIAEDNGRMLAMPSKYYITGVSMGGHITGAAVEAESLATANNVVNYAGAVPACGVMGGEYEFDYLQNFTFAAQHVADMGPDRYPNTGFDQAAIDDVLWNQPPPTFADLAAGTAEPADPTDKGLVLQGIVEQLTGGERPVFVQGFRGPYYNVVMGLGGRDGTIRGILARNLTGNTGFDYQFDGDPKLSDDERAFNNSILRIEADANANPPQADGLRWIPRINGEFSVPVVTLHDLGDMFVPFIHQRIYRERAEANGSDRWLVQRAIRASPHCDFTGAEYGTAFADMVNWEQNGEKPEGDDVVSPEVVADENYGCQFTTETRPGVAACPAN